MKHNNEKLSPIWNLRKYFPFNKLFCWTFYYITFFLTLRYCVKFQKSVRIKIYKHNSEFSGVESYLLVLLANVKGDQKNKKFKRNHWQHNMDSANIFKNISPSITYENILRIIQKFLFKWATLSMIWYSLLTRQHFSKLLRKASDVKHFTHTMVNYVALTDKSTNISFTTFPSTSKYFCWKYIHNYTTSDICI